jgi:hypothetical protein
MPVVTRSMSKKQVEEPISSNNNNIKPQKKIEKKEQPSISESRIEYIKNELQREEKVCNKFIDFSEKQNKMLLSHINSFCIEENVDFFINIKQEQKLSSDRYNYYSNIENMIQGFEFFQEKVEQCLRNIKQFEKMINVKMNINNKKINDAIFQFEEISEIYEDFKSRMVDAFVENRDKQK